MESSALHEAQERPPGRLQPHARAIIENSGRELSTISGNLVTAAGGKDPRTLLVTSCSPGEGKTTTAVALAMGLARGESCRVLLVDANLLSPRLHWFFGVAQAPGLAELVLDGAASTDLIQPTETPHLYILPAGQTGDRAGHVTRSRHLSEKIALLKERFDYVLFDTPHYLGPSDTSLLARHFDGIILVLACEKTRWEVLHVVEERMKSIGARLLGVVLNQRKYYIPKYFYRFL